MVGLMQIMIYMLSVYLVYKGIEIFQIALMSNRNNRIGGLIIGAIAVLVAVVAGISFSLWGDSVAKSISDKMNNMPGIR